MAKATAVEKDPWLEDANVDFTTHAEDKELAALAAEPLSVPTYNAEDFEIEGAPGESLVDFLQRAVPDADISVSDKLKGRPEPAAEPVPEPAAEPVAAVPDVSDAEVHQYPDGSSLTVEETPKGWKATLDSGDEAIKPEVFYGATKDEMWQNVAAGKINATKKIREQNRKMKLGAEMAEPAPAPVVTPTAQEARELTADEIFEIRTALDTNPDLAFETWFKKKTGLSTAELTKLVNKGSVAADELDAESESRDFLSSHPDYYVCQENLFSISAYLSKKYLKITQTAANAGDVYNRLVSGGYWTNTNLSEAYKELDESGLLELAPAATPEPEPEPQPTPRAKAPATAPEQAQPSQDDERIVRTVRRPRAGLGLNSKETVTVPPVKDPPPPSADDLDNLTDAQLAELYAGVRRTRLASRR